MLVSFSIEACGGPDRAHCKENFRYCALFLTVFLFCSPFHFSKNGDRHNSSLTSLCCSHKSIQADIKPPPKQKAIIEFDLGRRAGKEGRNGVDRHRSGNKMSQYIIFILFVCLIPNGGVFLNTVFKGFTPFTVFVKYWVYSPCCTTYHWTYFILSNLCLSLPTPVLCPCRTGNHYFVLPICESAFFLVLFTSLLYFVDSTCKWYHTLCVFLCLT